MASSVIRNTELVTMNLPSDLLATSFNGGNINMSDQSIYAEKDLSANIDYLGQLVGVLA